MLKYHDIQTVHLEPTQLCQASCPMCDRNKNGGEVNQYLKMTSLSLEDIHHLFPVDFLKQLNKIYMCGNHGDPIFAPDCLEMFRYFRDVPKLSITTNGGWRDPEWWEELASLNVKVNFSIDGLSDTNHLYRQGVKWDKVEENLDAFTSAGGIADWTFLVFNHNEHQVEEAERFAKLLGVNKFIVKKSGRYLTANLERKTEHQAKFRKGFGELLLEPANPKYKNKELQKDVDIVRIIETEEVDPKCVKNKEIYISAEGFVFPCCWTAGQMYKWYKEPESTQIWKNIKEHNIDALKTSVKDVIEGGFFNSIEKRWTCDRLDVCVLKCNKKFDPYEAQWK